MKGSTDAHVKAQESPYMREGTGKGTIINDVCVCKITGILDPSPLSVFTDLLYRIHVNYVTRNINQLLTYSALGQDGDFSERGNG